VFYSYSKFLIRNITFHSVASLQHFLLSYLLQKQRKLQPAQSVLQLVYWPAVSGIVFRFLAAATDYFQHQGNITSFGVDIACHSKGTGSPPEGLCDLGVKLTAHLHLVLPVRISGDILPKPHIHMWLTAKSIV
jgi:hypothetical protein